MQQAIKRERRKFRPKTSKNFEDLGNDLLNYDPVKDIYLGVVKGEDESVALLFSSVKLLKNLDKVQQVFMDGTFDVKNI